MKLTLACALAGGLIGCDGNGGTDAGVTPGTDGGGGGTDGGGGGCADPVFVSGEIAADTTWDCSTYVLDGRVYVVDGATLTIEPGTLVLGAPGVEGGSALIVTRGARLEAVGTAEAPIVFTSGNPEGERVTGDWAGVALMGSATTNDGACIDDADPSTPACDAPGFLEDRLEGIEVADDRGRYGGTDDASDCGTLRYVRIEFAGAELSPDNELNGLTVGACGSGTELSYVQIHRGKDDGVEFFGGTVSLDHFVITGPSDDGLDCDEGWRGTAQFVVIHQFGGIGDNGIECDNLGSDETATPRTSPQISNVTFVGSGEGRIAVLREGMGGHIMNSVAVNFNAPPDLRASEVDLNVEWPANLSWDYGYFYMTGAWPDESAADENDDGGYDEQAAFEDAARNNDFATDPMIGSDSTTAPSYVPGVALAGGTPTFGDTSATYAGALQMGGTDWTAGWTAYPAN
ncbi:MAG: hypothetical protein KC619_02300 [Myxococcales bacterium]|nr:hypothetical protein [Myxococcales bacterium]